MPALSDTLSFEALLHTTADVANAGRYVYQTARTLLLTREAFLAMFEARVFSRIPNPDSAGLAAYGRGLRDAYLTTILLEHCEFVYLLSDGSKVQPGSPLFPGMSEVYGAHQWKNTGLAFTAPRKVTDL